MSRILKPLGLLSALLFSGAVYATTTLHMATEYPASAMPGVGVSTFARLVEEKSKETVIVETSFDAKQGIKSADMVDAVQARKIDIGDAFAGGLANKYPLFAVSSLPFLADSIAKAQALAKDSRPAYEQFLAQHGQKLLYTTPWPASGIWSATPLQAIQNVKSLKIRTYDETSKDILSKLGAQAYNISWSNAMPRIVSGEVNAVLSSGDGGAGRKLWKYLPYFTEINYAMPISIATINLDAYNALDATGRAAIDDAAKQTESAQWERVQARLAINYDNMRKNGVNINTTPPAALMKALKDTAADAYLAWENKVGPAATEIMSRYKQEN